MEKGQRIDEGAVGGRGQACHCRIASRRVVRRALRQQNLFRLRRPLNSAAAATMAAAAVAAAAAVVAAATTDDNRRPTTGD